MNGGNTIASRTYPSLTAVGPLGIRLGEHFQAYAPIMNENVFSTCGPGLLRLRAGHRNLPVHRLAAPDQTHRHLPPHLLGHQAGLLNALHKVYAWALAQPIHPVFPSEFVEEGQQLQHPGAGPPHRPRRHPGA